MQIYLVGGAVRDKLLGRPVVDRDYLVVGATPEQLLEKGYLQVGKDFPVFLHPNTKEEYALARTERKSGRGYKGFVCDFSPEITLEQDLRRRDLTINAMALSEDGQLIDPFGGQKDLNDRQLRHVSDAFAEDPLRVFRAARFCARLHEHGFSIANETLALMRKIALSGELTALSSARVWQETARALLDLHPEVYFSTLKSVEALRDWFTELDKLWGIPNPAVWHPEIYTGVHTMMVLQQAVAMSDKLSVRYAALVHDLGKALTDVTNWPSHHQHDDLGIVAIKSISERLGVPNECRDLACLVSQHHSTVHRLAQKSPIDILAMLNGCDVWRKPERFADLLITCKADFMGRKNFSHRSYPQVNALKVICKACSEVNAQTFIQQGFTGKSIRQEIDAKRLQIIAALTKDLTHSL